jgi:predicted MFS family arabinose efflux permease
MRNALTLGITGFSLIAVSYGLARFSWGLMMPDVVRDIPFTPRVAGLLSACSFVAYCLTILCSPLLARRAGPRLMAAAAAGFAAIGLIVLALSSAPAGLAAGIFIAGLSPGLASPSLADAVSRVVAEKQQPGMNTLINAGTSAGIILSVPVLFFVPGGWRMACWIFALLALFCALPALRWLPRESVSVGAEKGNWRETLFCRPLLRLMIIAFVSGMASAAWWSFGPEILRHHVGVDARTANLLWLVSGAAGILGVLTGPVASSVGLHQVYRASQLCMATPLLLLAFSHGLSGWFYPAVALCGVGYITLSGVLLVCGVSAMEKAPATGASVVFFMLAAGQVAGATLFGLISAQSNATVALVTFSILSLLIMFLRPATQRK